jgi:hypothetical protein
MLDTFMLETQMAEGFRPVSGRFTEAQIADAIDLIRNAGRMPSYRHEYMLKEAITTSDFPYLFGTVIEREMIARYKTAPAPWTPFTKQSTLGNFNIHERHMVDGLTGRLDKVGEKGEYLVSPKPIHSRRYIQIVKKGRQFDISWEALINDGMGAFDDIAIRYADAARNTESYDVTSLYASATGPNTDLYGAPIVHPDGTNVTNLGALPASVENLETTLGLMASQVDALGNPIGIRGVHIVCAPTREIQWRNILTSAVNMWTESAGGAATPYPMTSVLPQMGLQLHVNPWLPIVDSSANNAGTWYLFADTSQGYAIEFSRLRGHEAPEIVMKASNKATPTGVPISPFEGDFETDNVFYRVRTATGGTQLDPRMTYAQVAT